VVSYIKKYYILVFAILLCACSQTPAKIVSTPNLKQNARNIENPFLIRIEKGDTLYTLSKEHNVPIRDLIDINRIRPPYSLSPNQYIRLPQAKFHVVKQGDTAFAISRSYGVDLGRLVHFNNLNAPYNISTGMKLKIPSVTEETQTAYNDNNPLYKTSTKTSDVKKLRKVVSQDLGLLDNNESKNTYILPKAVKNDPNAPSPKIKASLYPTPNLKPGSKYEKQFEAASYNYNAPIKNADGFNWPITGRVISQFGPKKGGLYNDGINIASAEGTPIKAADNGKVVYSGNELRGYGNLVLIKHSNGYITAYAHAQKTVVSKGDRVKKGDLIGYVGSTGHVSSPQLHFSIRRGRTALDPKKYLPRNWG